MAESKPHLNVFTIAPGRSFLDVLAASLVDGSLVNKGVAPDPLALADMEILLPSRRAARSLGLTFPDHVHGSALLLPRISTIGDVDEGPQMRFATDAPVPDAVVSDLERQIVLADIARNWAIAYRRKSGKPEQDGNLQTPDNRLRADPVPRSAGEAAAFAAELAGLIDAMEVEEIEFQSLSEILPQDRSHLAANWAINLEFLTHAMTGWAAYLAKRGLVSRIAHRSAEADGYTARLLSQGSAHAIVAAGSTGSVPATARMLKAIASLENGAVVLPGLDFDLDDASWKKLGPDHPQFGLKTLLDEFGIGREDVGRLGAPHPDLAPRAHLQSEAMRPAATAEKWITRLQGIDPGKARAGLANVSLVTAANDFEEARAIALMMRQGLEVPEARLALVTPDRNLARRVRSELSRWQIDIDDSAGEPLVASAPAVFLLLVAEMVATGFAPVPTLGLIKHPLARFGLSAVQVRRAARVVELLVFRGGRPKPGIAGMRAALVEAQSAVQRHPVLRRITDVDIATATQLLNALDEATKDLCSFADRSEAVPATGLIEALIAASEAVAKMPEGEAWGLWRGNAGDTLAGFLAELTETTAFAEPIEFTGLAGWLAQLMTGISVRAAGRGYQRLSILGPLEARLLNADTVILAGLNEGVWPSEADTDPWLGRHMLAAINLTPPERRIGLQAHDFSQGFLAPKVILTRSEKSDGTPTVRSRWLWRLAALIDGLDLPGTPNKKHVLDPEEDWTWLARNLDPNPPAVPCLPPRPTPPLEARPNSLSVTAIETWIRDPYAIYARNILDLTPLEPFDMAPEPRDYGTIIHDALAALLIQYPVAPLPQNALSELLRFGAEYFKAIDHRPGIRAYWWLRFVRVARWFVEEDKNSRQLGTTSHSEVTGRLELRGSNKDGPFVLTARADRIDLTATGNASIFDYKTGSVPSAREVAAVLAPQMQLEAAILSAGGFKDLPALSPQSLTYFQLSGREPAGQVSHLSGVPLELANVALEKVQRLVEIYNLPETAYRSRVAPKHLSYPGPYDQLARVKEWSQRAGSQNDK